MTDKNTPELSGSERQPVKVFTSWLLTPIFIVVFFSILLSFHPIYYLLPRRGRTFRRVLEAMNYCVLQSLRICGTKFSLHISEKIDYSKPSFLVSNHQSMYDIPLVICNFTRFAPVFIAKKELGSWIPSVSIALRRMGSLMIDRNEPRQSLNAISNFAKSLNDPDSPYKAICIFPEGTRARDGKIANFKTRGLKTLLECYPDAQLIPIAIEGSWRLVKNNLLPVPFGTNVRLTALDPIDTSIGISESISRCQAVIRQHLLNSCDN